MEPFHSFAERVLAFCNNIGHTIKAVLTAPAPFVANAPAVCKSGVTSPHPFKLATDELANKRPPLVSREDEELAAIKALKPFKARPVDPRVLNSAGDVGLVKVQRKPPTVPEPFSLESERLHRKAMEAKTKAMLELAEETKKASQFHAAPVPPSVKSGEHIAIPKPTVKAPTTTVDAPALQSDARAAEREKYEAEKAARAAEAEKAALEAAARAKVTPSCPCAPFDKSTLIVFAVCAPTRIQAREEAEVKELRRAASFKAAPFKKNGSPHILRSTKAPTCPLTPHFQTDKRAAARNHNGLVL